MHRRILITIALFFIVLLPAAQTAPSKSAGSGFFLHDGDRVVFYGDSITEQQMYGRDIENFVVTRYPNLKVKFINSGWSGDTASGGGGGPIDVRLKRDVLPYKPTVVTILLGMNDGGYRVGDAATDARYVQNMTHIADVLQKALPKARLVLLTPTFFDRRDRTDSNPNDTHNYQHPDLDYNRTLIKYGDWLKTFGAARGMSVIDLNAPMAAATAEGRKTDPNFTLAGDGVHPGEVGHLIMASAILSAWRVTPASLDMDFSHAASYTLNRTPLPWPVPDAARPAFAVSPLPGNLSPLRLYAKNFPDANVTLLADGKEAGMLTREQLAAGADLTQDGALPWNKQAQEVAAIVQGRINTWHNLYKGGNDAIAHASDKPTKAEVAALLATDKWLDEARERARQAAQPKPHTVELRPIGK